MNEICGCVYHINGMILTGDNKEVRDKLVSVPLLFTTNPKRIKPRPPWWDVNN